MRIKHTIKIIFILLLGMIQIHIHAQEDRTSQIDMNNKNMPSDNLLIYKTFFMPTKSPDTTQLIFYTKVANDMLQFVWKDSVYIAQFELTIHIQNLEGETVASRIIKRDVSTVQFMNTNSKDIFTTEQFNFFLKPGEYILFLEILDIETRIPTRQQEKINLPNFFLKPLVATDILFFHSLDTEKPFPIFPAVCSPKDSAFWARCYISSSIDSLRDISIKQMTVRKDGQIVHVDSFNVQMDSNIVTVAIKIDGQLDFGQYTLSLQISNTVSKISSE